LSPQPLRAGKPFHVPTEMLSELYRRTAGIRLVLLDKASVLERDGKLLLYRRSWAHRFPFHQVARLVEYPWLAERTACNHHRRTPCVLPHPESILGSLDVAVSNHRNLECINYRSDFLPARVPAVHLRSRARMQPQPTGARLLTSKPHRNRISHRLAPPATNLHRHRQMRPRRNSADHPLDELQILEATGSAIATNNLLHRTSEVDVDELGLESLGNKRSSISHRVRLSTKNL